jgi:hypothetical protein
VSFTYVLDGQHGNLQFGADEGADGVVRAHEKVGQMCMKALHANPGTADTALGLDEVVTYGRRTATLGVLIVRALQVRGVHQLLKSVNPGATFESTDRVVKLRINQPEQGRHWGAVTHVWLVFDDNWSSVDSAHHDRTSPRERSTE